jgi:heme-degrading monooxygenase HmoA
MILAISRFRIANEMQHEVEEAFVNRPHLVDTVPGFIGLEVFTNRADSSAVYLITRWTDVNSFHSWHYSPAHRISHQGIPKGLKLDPSQTELLFLQRIAEESAPIGGTVLDWPEMLSHFIAGSQLVCYFVADRAGIIQVCSAGFASALQMAREEVTGASLFSFMTEHSRTAIMVLIESRAREPRSTTMLSFRSRSGRYFTLECQLDVQPAAFAVIGSVSKEVQTQPYMGTLEDLNNRLAVEIRESARKGKELERVNQRLQETLRERDTMYWHLRKIQEVLPICLECGKVKTADGTWETLVEYFKANSGFLSHGYCPAYYAKNVARGS